jgi:DNA polymerase-3 subunit delta'
MNDATANRMLKTLEEPPAYAHLILLSDRPGELLPTVSSRCQHVRFDALPSDELARRLEQRGIQPQTALACARLALGDGERALAYALGNGPALRAAAEALARGTGERPWLAMLELGKSEGELVAAQLAEQHAEQLELAGKQEKQRLKKEHEERARRAERRAKAATLDRGLALTGLWFRDAACIAERAPELVHAVDRADQLAAEQRSPVQLRTALELVEDTRSRLALNVNEELALEALAYRLAEIGPSSGSRS